MAKKRLPTDLEILNLIWEDYHEEYEKFDPEQPKRRAKVYVPINIAKIAEKLGAEPDIVFGRLYYHLAKKHSYEDEDGTKVLFFSHGDFGDTEHDKDQIQFPYMAAVLADLRQEHGKVRRAYQLAFASFIISLVSLGMNFAKTIIDMVSHGPQG